MTNDEANSAKVLNLASSFVIIAFGFDSDFWFRIFTVLSYQTANHSTASSPGAFPP